jgi:ubiquilin
MTDPTSNDPPTATDEESVTFNVKSNQGKWTLTLPVSTTAIDLKNKLASSDYAGVPAESQRLIYSGRVLKDDDTLLSHKVKEGNTMHLVKSAPSNQRQNPANQGVSSATAPPSSIPQATGVPQNIAAGTGNDPFAALTGARYAGFSQLPSADMFGADGGVSVTQSANCGGNFANI